jgi:Flp pilus assembly pilin Flp
VRNILHDTRGVASIEYAILAVGIIAAVAAAIGAFAPSLLSAFTSIGTQLNAAM